MLVLCGAASSRGRFNGYAGNDAEVGVGPPSASFSMHSTGCPLQESLAVSLSGGQDGRVDVASMGWMGVVRCGELVLGVGMGNVHCIETTQLQDDKTEQLDSSVKGLK